jgi:hypothetical protein
MRSENHNRAAAPLTRRDLLTRGQALLRRLGARGRLGMDAAGAMLTSGTAVGA